MITIIHIPYQGPLNIIIHLLYPYLDIHIYNYLPFVSTMSMFNYP